MIPYTSIIVNCFNQAAYLERAVKSVLSQTFQDLECIIVDDGSTDKTSKVAEYLLSLDPRVRYCYKQNGGLASARNFGVEQARGEWIQLLDADDWIHEDKIRFQLSHSTDFDAKDTVFYCDYARVLINPEGEITATKPQIIGVLTRPQLIDRLLIPDFLANSPHPALQQCFLMKKNIFKRQRFLDNVQAMTDRYFALEMLAEEVTFTYTPLMGAFYTKHQGNMTNNWNILKSSYIAFYETVCRERADLQKRCDRGIEFFIDEAVREKDSDSLERLAKIAPYPLKIFEGKIKIKNKLFLKIAYTLRRVTPGFLWYQKYRGDRLVKIFAFLGKLPNRL